MTGLARLDGRPVGVMGNDPRWLGGAIDGAASDKMVRFVDLCDTFHLPVVNFVDNPGFLIGVAGEKAGTIRRGARAIFSVYQASVPWCSIIVRRVFGVAGAAHGNHSKLNLRYAWPSGEWGSLPIEGGVEAAYKRDLEAARRPRRAAPRARREARRACARPSAPPRASASRRSSTRATRARCSAIGSRRRIGCCPAELGTKARGMRP